MIRMIDLEHTGQSLDSDKHDYPELMDHVLQSPKRVEISQVRQRAYGIVMSVNKADREDYGLPPNTAAIMYWSDGHPDDESSGLNTVTAEELKELIASSTQAAIDYIVAHYRAIPGNDGHPAYRLFELATGEAG